MFNPDIPPPDENSRPEGGLFGSTIRKGWSFLRLFPKLICGDSGKSHTPPQSAPVTNVSHNSGKKLVPCLSMKAWPFMFGRTFSADYDAVAIPAFIKNAGAGRELGNACDNLSVATDAIHMKCFHPKVGEFDLVFRIVNATKRMLGKSGDEVICDDGGRPVRIMEGLAFQGRLTPEQLHFTKAQLDAAHNILEPSFCQFWEGDLMRPPLAVMNPIDLPHPTGETLSLHSIETPNAITRLQAEMKLGATAVKESSQISKFERIGASKPPRTGGLNTTAMFLAVTGVALGAILTHRHFAHSKEKQGGFANRVQQSHPETISGRTF